MERCFKQLVVCCAVTQQLFQSLSISTNNAAQSASTKLLSNRVGCKPWREPQQLVVVRQHLHVVRLSRPRGQTASRLAERNTELQAARERFSWLQSPKRTSRSSNPCQIVGRSGPCAAVEHSAGQVCIASLKSSTNKTHRALLGQRQRAQSQPSKRVKSHIANKPSNVVQRLDAEHFNFAQPWRPLLNDVTKPDAISGLGVELIQRKLFVGIKKIS